MSEYANDYTTTIDHAQPGGMVAPGFYLTLKVEAKAPLLATETDDVIAAAKAGPAALDAWWAARPEPVRSAWWAALPPGARDSFRIQLASFAAFPLPHGLAGFGGHP